MITKIEISRRWKKTLYHLVFALVVIFGVIIYLIMKKINSGVGPSIVLLAIIAAVTVVFSLAFVFVGRLIRKLVTREFGED